MLRHIISVTLAITACATLIPTKVNAATLTVTPAFPLKIPRNPGETVKFTLYLDPAPSNIVILKKLSMLFFDVTEFSNWFEVDPFIEDGIVANKRIIASFDAIVSTPDPDGNPDFRATVSYEERISGKFETNSASVEGGDVVPVPEPLTIFGTATAMGCGILFKRKSSKKTVA